MAAIPDFGSAAAQQGVQNFQSAWDTTAANRSNQTNGMGSMGWTYDPTNRQWTQSVTNANQGINDQLAGVASGDLANLGDWGSTDITRGVSAMPEGGYGAVQSVIDATQRLQEPSLSSNENTQRQRLAAMGITMGSDASNDSERNLGNVRTDAADKAILAGTTEYGNVFNRQMQQRQQGVNENVTQSNLMNALRAGKMNEATGAMTSIKNNQPTFASYSSSPTIAPTDTYGALADTWRAAQQQQSAQAAGKANNTAGNVAAVGGITGALGGLSGITSGIKNIWGMLGNGSGTNNYDTAGMDQLMQQLSSGGGGAADGFTIPSTGDYDFWA